MRHRAAAAPRVPPRSRCSIRSIASRASASSGRILLACSHSMRCAGDALPHVAGMRREAPHRARTPRPRTESRTDTCRSRSLPAASGVPRAASRRDRQLAARRGEDQIEERRDTQVQRRAQHRRDVRWMCALLNSRSTPSEKLSMPKPSTRKPARRMAASRSTLIASMRLVLMNCKPARNAARPAWPR